MSLRRLLNPFLGMVAFCLGRQNAKVLSPSQQIEIAEKTKGPSSRSKQKQPATLESCVLPAEVSSGIVDKTGREFTVHEVGIIQVNHTSVFLTSLDGLHDSVVSSTRMGIDAGMFSLEPSRVPVRSRPD